MFWMFVLYHIWCTESLENNQDICERNERCQWNMLIITLMSNSNLKSTLYKKKCYMERNTHSWRILSFLLCLHWNNSIYLCSSRLRWPFKHNKNRCSVLSLCSYMAPFCIFMKAKVQNPLCVLFCSFLRCSSQCSLLLEQFFSSKIYIFKYINFWFPLVLVQLQPFFFLNVVWIYQISETTDKFQNWIWIILLLFCHISSLLCAT